MPDEDADYARRGARLTPVLLWAGLGLAPLAGLLLLLGIGGLRAGALLGVLALVMIAVSIALRPDPTRVRMQLEEILLDELDRLRVEVREDIANASRATHQTVGERMGALQHLVESLRAERARFAAPHSAVPTVVGQPPAGRPAVGHPGARHPGAGHPGASHPGAGHPAGPRLAAGPPVGSHPVTQLGTHPVASHPVAPPPMAAPRSIPPQPDPALRHPDQSVGRRPDPSGGRHPGQPVSGPAAAGRPGGRRSARQQEPEAAPAGPAPSRGRAAAPVPPTGGVYRHTETVHVTTRSTYVDEHAPNGDGGRRYDGGYSGRDWSDQAPRSRPAEPYEESRYQESWTDQKLRERYGRRPRPYDRADDAERAGEMERAGEVGGGEQPWSRDGAPWHPVSAEPVSGSVPSGPPGRPHHRRWDGEPAGELRIGQRRAAARHSDEHGTELRLEERWASLRRDEAGRGRADHRGADQPVSGYPVSGYPASAYPVSGYPNGGYQSADYPGADYGQAGDDREPEPDYTRPALPASAERFGEVGGEPSWNDSWEEPVRQSRGHRYRPEFELSDERWR